MDIKINADAIPEIMAEFVTESDGANVYDFSRHSKRNVKADVRIGKNSPLSKELANPDNP